MPSVKILTVIAIVLGGLAFLIASALGGNMQQFVSITELLHQDSAAPDTVYKLEGRIVDGTVTENPKVPKLFFDLDEGPGTTAIHVESGELKPDNFIPGNKCFVEGTFDRAASRFSANKVMTKCPSKYEGQEEPKASQP